MGGELKNLPGAEGLWCEKGDLNPHGLPRQILSLVRLPVPPFSLIGVFSRGGLEVCYGITSPFGVSKQPLPLKSEESLGKMLEDVRGDE